MANKKKAKAVVADRSLDKVTDYRFPDATGVKGKSEDQVADFEIAFSPDLSPEQARLALTALADYYRACGGIGFEVEVAPLGSPPREVFS